MGQRFQQAPVCSQFYHTWKLLTIMQKTHATYGGSGLGLFIARKLSFLLGGELHFESEYHHGSTFSFYVAASKCAPPSKTTITSTDRHHPQLVRQRTRDRISFTKSANNKNPASGYEILVVEDNIINQNILKKQLSAQGCIVTVANDGEQALQVLKDRGENPFTIILMDQEMPVCPKAHVSVLVASVGR